MIKSFKVFLFLSILSIVLGLSNQSLFGKVDFDNPITINVPSEFSEEQESKWKSIGNYLVNSNYHTYVLNWRGDGGYIRIGKEFIEAIKRAEAQGKDIVFNIVGDSFSVHAFVPCYGTKIIRHDKVLMYHADSYEKNGEDYRVKESASIITNELNQCVSVHVLKPEDIRVLWQGNLIWVYATHTDYHIDARPIG